MQTLRQNWDRFLTWLKPARRAGPRTITPADLERVISAISDESRGLAEAVQRVRADLEQARVEESRKIVHLEEVRQAMQLASEEDRRKLTELASIKDQYAQDRDTDRRKIDELENRLASLETERDRTHERLEAMRLALTESESRLEQAQGQIRALQVNMLEESKRFQVAVADADERLTATDNRIRVLGSRLDSEHRQILQTFEELQARIRRQDTRLSWTVMVAVIAILLGAVVGTVLFREAQMHAVLLTDVSRDIRDLVTAVNARPAPPPLRQEPLPPAPVTPVPSRPATDRATTPQAAPSQPPAADKPLSLTTMVDRARLKNREGVRQPTRQEADSFFAGNAQVPGMISLDSGVQYRVLKPGGGPAPTANDKVVIAYVGTKLDGTVIDETYSEGVPATYGMDEIMPAWREVLLKMEEGSEFELYVPPTQSSRGGVRNRGVTGFEPTIYLIELIQVIRASTPASPAPAN